MRQLDFAYLHVTFSDRCLQDVYKRQQYTCTYSKIKKTMQKSGRGRGERERGERDKLTMVMRDERKHITA